LGRHWLGGNDFELSRTALAVKQQRFLVGEGRTLRSAAVFAAVFGCPFRFACR
jgi:hypothetical protein